MENERKRKEDGHRAIIIDHAIDIYTQSACAGGGRFLTHVCTRVCGLSPAEKSR